MKYTQNNKPRRVNQVQIEFTNKPITAWGGIATVVAKFLEEIDFRSWVEKQIPIKEESNNSKGIYSKVVAQFLTSMTGGSRFGHLSWWGHGIEAIKKTFGLEWLPATSSVMTRFWNKISSQALAEKLGDACRKLAFVIIRHEGIKEDNLNFDSSVFTRYGNQEGAKRGYNPKKRGRPSHHPLLAFLGSGYIVNLWNRSGNTGAGQGIVDFFRQTLIDLGDTFRIKRVLCDSGFYKIEFIQYLESKGFIYIIAAPMSEILQKDIYRISSWRKIDNGIQVAEFNFKHLDTKWDQPRRYIVIRQQITKRPKASGKQLTLFKELKEIKEYRYSCMITNDTQAPEEIWREYRPRANDENVIKDLKEGYGIAAFNLHNFWATEAVMVMNALVFHNLFHHLNRTIINPHSPKEQLRTVRYKYFIIPALLGRSGGKAALRLGVRNKSLRSKLCYFLEKISSISFNLNCIAVDT
jgi:hypothetical protein